MHFREVILPKASEAPPRRKTLSGDSTEEGATPLLEAPTGKEYSQLIEQINLRSKQLCKLKYPSTKVGGQDTGSAPRFNYPNYKATPNLSEAQIRES